MQFSKSHALEKLFSGITEHTFFTELGFTDLSVVDYLTRMLTRFVHRDGVYAVSSPRGRRLLDLAEMLAEAQRPVHDDDKRREIYRHIGDYALFWTGVYPEQLETRAAASKRESLVNFFEQGKRSYYIASTYSDKPAHREQAPVLRHLSDQFEVCAFGLRKVRDCWEREAQ